MNRLTLLAIFTLSFMSFNAVAQDDYLDIELIHVCDPNNVVVYGEKQPKPKEGIHKIEYVLNRDSKFLVNNPKFKGTVFIECTVSCTGEVDNFNVIVPSENSTLDYELIKLLGDIDSWNVGKQNGIPVDYWYLWKFKVKKGKLTILDKKKYYN